MSGAYLFGYDEAVGDWIKLVCNSDGKLILDNTMNFDDIPVDGELCKGITSNWAHDHKADAGAHHSKTALEENPTNGETEKAPSSNWAYDHKNDASAHHSKTALEENPTNGETTKAPSSNWAYDHKADASAHHVKTTDDEIHGLIHYSTAASKPAAGTSGRLWYETDTSKLFYDNGTNWIEIETGSGGGSMEVWVTPNDFNHSNCTQTNESNFSTINLRDGLTPQIWANVKVPPGASGIDSVELYYWSANTGNIYMLFRFGQFTLASGESITTDETDSYSTYSGSSGVVEKITAPAASYNAITVAAGDLLGIHIIRAAADANDTYDANLEAFGLLVTFN